MTRKKDYHLSQELFEVAKKHMPGGVSSPVRSFNAMGIKPIAISYGKGSHVYDIDDNEYIDYVCSYGPLILGHSHPDISSTISNTAQSGTSFGSTSEPEVQLATMICQAVPSIETIRFVNSGTEATMSALRLARAATGRNKILKFEGCYHGHSDSLLAQSGSGISTFDIPGSPGVPESFVKETITIPYNNIEKSEEAFQNLGEEIAAVIVEPVAANMGVVTPRKNFLRTLRNLTNEYGAILIFDEVITGFRLSYGGAQEVFDIKPDITCLGKIIGGGLPIGAYGGNQKIMQLLAPVGPVYQAGTLSGNPIVMSAGIATLKLLSKSETYSVLSSNTERLDMGLKDIAKRVNIPIFSNRAGSLITLFFTNKPVTNYQGAKQSDLTLYAQFFSEMIKGGVFLAPSQFEAMFVSLAHTKDDIDRTLEIAESSLRKLKM